MIIPWGNIRGITVSKCSSRRRGTVYLTASGGPPPPPRSPLCLWYHILLCSQRLCCSPSDIPPAGCLPRPTVPGDVKMSAGEEDKDTASGRDAQAQGHLGLCQRTLRWLHTAAVSCCNVIFHPQLQIDHSPQTADGEEQSSGNQVNEHNNTTSFLRSYVNSKGLRWNTNLTDYQVDTFLLIKLPGNAGGKRLKLTIFVIINKLPKLHYSYKSLYLKCLITFYSTGWTSAGNCNERKKRAEIQRWQGVWKLT